MKREHCYWGKFETRFVCSCGHGKKVCDVSGRGTKFLRQLDFPVDEGGHADWPGHFAGNGTRKDETGSGELRMRNPLEIAASSLVCTPDGISARKFARFSRPNGKKREDRAQFPLVAIFQNYRTFPPFGSPSLSLMRQNKIGHITLHGFLRRFFASTNRVTSYKIKDKFYPSRHFELSVLAWNFNISQMSKYGIYSICSQVHKLSIDFRF